MAWRSLYQPHDWQTRWGNFTAPHWLQMLREADFSFQAEALRLRPLALDVFFLGTAILLSRPRN